jgi:tetratricopeptide (TPR) repeat protein
MMDVQELEIELAAARRACENLLNEVTSYEHRANALSDKAWRWIFRYGHMKRAFLQRVRVLTPQTPTRDPAIVQQSEQVLKKLIELTKTQIYQGNNEAARLLGRLIVNRFPSDKKAASLLSLVGSLETTLDQTGKQRANTYTAMGDAYYLLEENQKAAANYEVALAFEPDLPAAHSGLASISMPGISYLAWLELLYQFLKPATVIEIGVSQSASLARIPAPTVAIGIDPSPSVVFPLQTETHLYVETSDQFFQCRDVPSLLRDHPVSIAFIDGLHLFEQALRDFIHLEKLCGSKSVILFHDTVPLNELTQRRRSETHFSTGDVWKVVLCLKEYRSDLEIFTVATPPTGLTIVVGLDPFSTVLADRYQEAVAKFIDMPFLSVAARLHDALSIVPNNWDSVKSRLIARGIPG